MTSEARIKEIVESAATNGTTKTLETYGIPEETFNRYKREYRKKFGDTADIVGRVRDKFSDSELETLLTMNMDKRPREKGIITFEGEDFKFLVLSDTHIGSIYFEDELLLSAMEEGKKQGCTAMLHAGDIIEGMSTRPGQIYELTEIGYAAQRNKAVELFKQWGKPMYFCIGNHSDWFNTKSGVGLDVGEDIESRIPDSHYVGVHEGIVDVNGVSFMLWHGEDGSCFDNKTEIQTKAGWKYFADLTKDDYVATMTKDTHEFQWQHPTDIFIKEYTGDMIHFNSRTVDCMVTPNHGMWTRVSDTAVYRRQQVLTMPQKSHIRLNTKWHRKTAGDILKDYSRQKWQFTKKCDSWVGTTPDHITVPFRESKNTGKKVYHFGDVSTEDMAELIAWYVTEGHARKNTVAISQYKSVNGENYSQIVDLAKRLGANFGVHDRGIVIHSTELGEYLRATCGHMSRHKYLPEWIKESDTEILELVLNTMIAGDGWIRVGEDSFGYKSISPRLRDDFAEIAIKCGYAVHYSHDEETVGIYKTQATPTVNTRPVVVQYSGTIHCCAVPNGLIHVRRNGKTLWTHNSYATSYRVQKIIEAFTGGEKPKVLIVGHSHKMVYIFERNIHAISAGSIQRQSGFMRYKRLAAHTGFWIVSGKIRDGEITQFTPTWYPFYK